MKFIYPDMNEPFKINYPDDFEKFMFKIMPKKLIYDRYRQEAYCSNCEKHFSYSRAGKMPKQIGRIVYPMPTFYSGDQITCPACGARAEAVPHTQRIISTKLMTLFWQEDSGETVKFAIVSGYWKYTGEPLDFFEPVTTIYPEEIGVISRQEQTAYLCYGQNYWGKLTPLYIHQSINSSCPVIHPNHSYIIDNSFLKHATKIMRDADLNSMIKELALNAKYPQAEFVAKAGLEGIVRNKVYGIPTYIWPNWRAKSIPEFLRLTSQDVDKLKQWNMWDIDHIGDYIAIRKFHKKITKSMLETFESFDRCDHSWWHRNFSNQDPVRLAKYLNKIYTDGMPHCSHGFAMYTKEGAVREYSDYLYQLRELNYDIQDDYYLYPKDFIKAHEKIQKEYREMQEQKDREQKRIQNLRFSENVKKLENYCFENQKYLIRPLRTRDEFIDEGAKNHNCVASYFNRAVEGKAKIFVIRQKEEPDKSFVTLELSVDEKKIIQCLGCGNRLPEESVLEFAKMWLKSIVLNPKRKQHEVA